MKKVIRYLCPHCGKLFKTPNRHFCWKDPANRACASCEGWGGTEIQDYMYGYGKWSICELTGKYIFATGDVAEGLPEDIEYVNFEKRRGNRGYMCPHWKPRKSWVAREYKRMVQGKPHLLGNSSYTIMI